MKITTKKISEGVYKATTRTTTATGDKTETAYGYTRDEARKALIKWVGLLEASKAAPGPKAPARVKPRPERKPSRVTLNKQQKLYTIPTASGGFSCLGFDVLMDRAWGIDEELCKQIPGRKAKFNARKGTLKAYHQYKALLDEAREVNTRTGRRFTCELTPQLIGLEGNRVEVVDKYGDKRRFWVDKSTGWIPCHIERIKSNSTGGGAAFGAPYKSVKVIK